MVRSKAPTREPGIPALARNGRASAGLKPVRRPSSSTPGDQMPAPRADPQVGFFWFVGRRGQWRLVAEGLRLDDAERYGEHLTHPGGHYDHWTALAARGRHWLQANGYPDEIAVHDYEDFPRGRVVYDLTDRCFVLYVDPRLRGRKLIVGLVDRFGLRGQTVVVRLDSHYRAAPRETDDPGDSTGPD